MKTKTYLFKVEILGHGEDETAAWRDAVEAFMDDPGYFHEVDQVCDSCQETIDIPGDMCSECRNEPEGDDNA
jgi:hypothetical protein